MKNKKISIIVPCYNEEESLPIFYQELMKNINLFENVDFEFIFVKLKNFSEWYVINEIRHDTNFNNK